MSSQGLLGNDLTLGCLSRTKRRQKNGKTEQTRVLPSDLDELAGFGLVAAVSDRA